MLLYLINLLYEKIYYYKMDLDTYGILNDSLYISELGYAKRNNNVMDVHEKLITVVNILNKYCLKYEEIVFVICSLLKKTYYKWVLEKYDETFYKYISLKDDEIALNITKNLLVNNQLAVSV